MKNMFLASSFVEVVKLFESFVEGECEGKIITFIPTASNPEDVNFYVASAKEALEELGFIIDELDIATAAKEEMEGLLQGGHMIYVTGGNTFYLLQELRKSGADKILIEQIQAGKPYVGESAGAMVLAKSIEYAQDMNNEAQAPDLESYEALGMIDFYPLPHYGNYPFQETVSHVMTVHGDHLSLHPFSNSQAIVIKGDKFEVLDA